MLVWADRRNWVSRGLVPDDVLHPPSPAELVESIQPAHS
jgi:hypothetical protein